MNTAEADFLAELEGQIEALTSVHASAKILIYGTDGAGKTTAAMQLAQVITPPDKTILFIDSWQGWASLQNIPALLNRAIRMTVKNIGQIENLASVIGRGKFANVGTVIIDQHSSFAQYDLLELCKARASVDTKKDPDDPSWPDRNASGNRVTKATAAILRLDKVNLILVAHEREDKDDRSIVVTSPLYSPALGKTINGMCHMIAHITADNSGTDTAANIYERKMQVHPTARVVAKTAIGGFNKSHVTIKEFIMGIKEWLNGNRETIAKVEVEKVQEVVNTEVVIGNSSELDDLSAQLEEI